MAASECLSRYHPSGAQLWATRAPPRSPPHDHPRASMPSTPPVSRWETALLASPSPSTGGCVRLLLKRQSHSCSRRRAAESCYCGVDAPPPSTAARASRLRPRQPARSRAAKTPSRTRIAPLPRSGKAARVANTHGIEARCRRTERLPRHAWSPPPSARTNGTVSPTDVRKGGGGAHAAARRGSLRLPGTDTGAWPLARSKLTRHARGTRARGVRALDGANLRYGARVSTRGTTPPAACLSAWEACPVV